ncbi:PhoD-like phosphatase N-terminal domain-containing protein [Aquincola sp. S2]|uniref:PhoD-like phosphatase N-terminal domain-containing protein n=1 Tax=Pseudaquabacterium terrae TaxID=2732868 RepID=A0ABX2EM84_9BURK|nr:PhoD-like phosphatase N-terminal domain-containing protein [Aquabacterium terrae]NRF69685.1 PhoD-like phosphatase N-terminal domain-containing protein [Aquabacterium terrae]
MRSSFTLDRRRLLVLAAAPAFVRQARAADEPRFALGVASGQPQPDRLVLWTRLTGAGLAGAVDVQWELAEDEAFTRIAARGRETAEAAWAHSVHAEPAGLQPGRWYRYRFERPEDPASAVGVQARFAVEAGRPDPQRT